MSMYDDIKEVLITEDQIKVRIKELAQQVDKDYADKQPVFLGILKGCLQFMIHFLDESKIYSTAEFIKASSFKGGLQSVGEVEVTPFDFDIQGKDIIILEDIIDTGETLLKVRDYLLEKHARSVEIATLLDKPSHRKVVIDVKYVGFEVPDAFLVGYGLDYAEKYRNLPFVGTLKEEVIKW